MAKAAKAYKFLDIEPPTKAGRGKSTFYRDMLDDFLSQAEEGKALAIEADKKPITLYVGLKKEIAEREQAGKPVGVSVSKRVKDGVERVWLFKE